MSKAPQTERDFVRKLRSSGYRVTEPRLKVIDSLSQARNPMSAKEIYDDISRNISDPIDVATVYRILERFTDLGICHQIGPSGKYLICHKHESTPDFHILTRCTGCAAIAETNVPNEVYLPLTWYVKQMKGFSAMKSMLQIDGLCADCAEKDVN